MGWILRLNVRADSMTAEVKQLSLSEFKKYFTGAIKVICINESILDNLDGDLIKIDDLQSEFDSTKSNSSLSFLVSNKYELQRAIDHPLFPASELKCILKLNTNTLWTSYRSAMLRKKC